MKNVLATSSLFLFSCFAHAAQASCMTGACKIGDVLIVRSTKENQAIACTTKGMQRYVGAMVTLRQARAAAGQKFTPDQITGDTKKAMDQLRKEAGDMDFEQASQACRVAPDGQHVTLVELDAESTSALVEPTGGRPKYWVDRSALSR